MDFGEVLKALASLTPEEREKVAGLFGQNVVQKEPPKQKNPPALPEAKPVYFFIHLKPIKTTSIRLERNDAGELMVKEADELPPRIIAVDERMASKLFYKHRGKFQYLSRSPGRIWRQARSEGKSVEESQKMELEYAYKNPDHTPPSDHEKTVFAGTKIGSIMRGVQMDWKIGLKQQGKI